jgi:large subunit ribosomal protein L21e
MGTAFCDDGKVKTGRGDYQWFGMSGRSKGLRSKGRKKLTKHPRERGLGSVVRATQEFSPGTRITIVIDPAIHKGQPHHRYQGMVGLIREKRGRAYVIEMKNGGKIKKIISGPEHLRVVR